MTDPTGSSAGPPSGEAVGDGQVPAEMAAAQLAERSGVARHDVAVILGTGLADAAAAIGPDRYRQDLGGLCGFPDSLVAHQRSEVWSLEAGGLRVLAFLGRLHLYEGYTAAEVAHPVRTAVAAGCRTVVITNASGSLRPELGPGDLVVIGDHLNLTGASPLVAAPGGADRPNPFVDLVDAWSPRLRALVAAVEPGIAEGIYAQVRGPQFETPAEIRMLRTMGADLVGMSSALEVVAARQMDAEVLGLSLVTNLAAGMEVAGVSPEAIIGVARREAPRVGRVIRQVLDRLPPGG